MLGILAGLLLRTPRRSNSVKILLLILAGAAGVYLGMLWDPVFPIIKKVWTSSYVLMAGGYSALLLAAFYLVVDVWGLRRWCLPLVWVGTNSITIYVARQVVPWSELTQRLVGGDLANWLNNRVAAGAAQLAVLVVSLLLQLLLVRFLYQRKIFLRL